MKQVKLSDVSPDATSAPEPKSEAAPLKTISVGEVLGDTFKVFGANGLNFCLIAVLAFVPLVAWVIIDTGSIQLLKGDMAQFSWGASRWLRLAP